MPSYRSTTGRMHFFDQQVQERLHLPTEEGSALPNCAYIDADFYELEQRTLFRNTWVFAGFAHQLQNSGDMLPVEVAGQPIVLVRDHDNQVRGFYNVCRHRGAQLVLEPKFGAKTFVCPNHSWSYELSGRLVARPHFFGGERHDLNREPCHRADLAPVRTAVWHDWVFVNLSGNAESLDHYLGPITRRLEGYDFDSLRFSEALEFDVQANWKLPIENFIEPYHVFSCHPWLNSFVSMAERTPPEFDSHVLYCGYRFQQTDPARGEGLPYFPNLSEEKKKRGDWFVLFPNFAFEVFPDQVDVFISTPLSVEQTRETIALYFVGEGADHERYAEARNTVIRNWHDLNNEDIGVIERMQAGRHAEGFDGGVLSPYWDPALQHYAQLIYGAIQHESTR